MDGNRRYSKKCNMDEGAGHKSGFTALTTMLRYCYELEYGVRVHFAGDLKLLDEFVRLAAEKDMAASACNSKAVLSICIAYTSTNEIMNVVQQSCEENWDELRILDSCGAAYGLTDYSGNEDTKDKKSIVVTDIEKHIYMKVAPNSNIVVRTSGENRMSNFLLWQSAYSILYSLFLL
ncbi:Dehydrodolichyl diphosphate synthase 6 [Bienertia sinuspersici]